MSSPRHRALAELGAVAFDDFVARYGDVAFDAAPLEAWLDGTVPRAVVAGTADVARSVALARWVARAAAARGMTPVYVPVQKAFETALERDALSVFAVRLAAAGMLPAERFRPEGIMILRGAVEEAISQGVEPDGTPLLVVIDALYEAIDWRPGRIFARLGPGVRVMIAARDESWAEALGWAPGAFVTVGVSSSPPRGLRPEATNEGGTRGAVLQVLADALGPMRADEIVTALARAGIAGEESGVLSALAALPREPLRRDAHGRAALVDPAGRSELRQSGEALRAWTIGPAASAAPSYWTRYRRPHLVAATAPLAISKELVTPEWLEAWRHEPDFVLGFASDVRAVRHEAGDHPGLQVRCAAVEVSVLELGEAAGRREAVPADRAGASRRKEAAALAHALHTLATVTSGSARTEILDAASDVARLSADPEELLTAARAASDRSTAVNLAREAVRTAGNARDESDTTRVLVRAAWLLPPGEAEGCIDVAFEHLERLGEPPASLPFYFGLDASVPDAVVAHLWARARTLIGPARLVLASLVAPRLTLVDRADAVAGVAKQVLEYLASGGSLHEIRGAVEALAPALSEADTVRLLAAARAADPEGYVEPRKALSVALAAHGAHAEALTAASEVKDETNRLGALARVARHLPDVDRTKFAPALAAMLAEMDPGSAGRAIVESWDDLIEIVPTRDLLAVAYRTEGIRRMCALACVARRLPTHERVRVATDIGQALAAWDEANDETLFELVPYADVLLGEDARQLLLRLLETLVHYARRDSFLAWYASNVGDLGPLLVRIGGEQAVLESARELVAVDRWLG